MSVTNSTRLIGLIMTAALLSGGAAAEQVPPPDFDANWGQPDLTLPSLRGEENFDQAPAVRDERLLVAPDQLAPEPLHDIDALHGYAPGAFLPGPHDFWDPRVAPIESTGTWLRRGFWYAEAEAVVWNRMWNRNSKFLAVEDPNVLNPVFFLQPVVVHNTNRMLLLDGAQPGRDASVRVTLGQFLFRDLANRDHAAEFTAFGGGEWHQHRVISSDPPFGLFVPFFIDGGNRSFDGSTRQQVDYSSRYSSFEGNYRVKWRMGRDQLVMDPNGHWHRAARSGWTHQYLVGLRFMEHRDIMDWLAEDIFMPGSDGAYNIRTDNDMFGFQMGGGFAYETSRWSLGLFSKGGVFLNDALGRVALTFTADDDDDFDLRLRTDGLSFIGEAQLTGKWHLTPNFSLRASYEVMLLTSQAAAPVQATFIPEFAFLNTSRDIWYHGASFGFEGYW